MNVVNHIFLVGMYLACAFVAFAQNPPAKEVSASLNSCEEISGNLDVVGTRFSDYSGPSSKLIILGGIPNEAKLSSADDAVADAIKYLVKFHKIDEANIGHGVFRSAERTRTTVLEFFVRGELITKIRTRPGARLCFGMGETFRP